MKEQDLYLDPSIRDWVLIPITLVMVLVGLLRHYVTQLLNSAPKKQPAAVVREQRGMVRSMLLRSSAPLSPLPPALYKAFSTTLSSSLSAGEFLQAKKEVVEGESDGPANPFDAGQMDAMMDGMKKQGVMMVPNMLIMQYISVFFSGFILIKLPFPLTLGFKSMLSRDIAMSDLDVRWVSALSWYFLNLFGLNGVFKLILGSETPTFEPRDTMSTSTLSGAGAVQSGPGAPDMGKLFKAEVENLALAQGVYRWVGEGIEDRVLARWAKV
ncbi:ER membrane protein complex subunit 3, partial [Tremellales sp. Uapishka_1]